MPHIQYNTYYKYEKVELVFSYQPAISHNGGAYVRDSQTSAASVPPFILPKKCSLTIVNTKLYIFRIEIL
jgi:hypothetical protein